MSMWIKAALAAFLVFSGMGRAAAQSAHVLHFCDKGKVATGVSLTLTEAGVWNASTPNMAPRPDTLHKLFMMPRHWSGDVMTLVWMRGGAMYRLCRREYSCNDQQSGRQVATVAGPATVGAPSEACEPEETVTVSRCSKDGTLSTQSFTGTMEQLRSFIGQDPSAAQGRILHSDEASGTPPEWRSEDMDTLRQICRDNAQQAEAAGPQNYEIETVDESISGCPPQVSAMAGAAMPLGASSRIVSWSTPPHPLDLLPTTSQLGAWQRDGDGWVLRYQPESVQQPGSPMDVRVSYHIGALKQDEIGITGFLQVLMAPELAQIAGFGGRCEYIAEFVARRVAR